MQIRQNKFFNVSQKGMNFSHILFIRNYALCQHSLLYSKSILTICILYINIFVRSNYIKFPAIPLISQVSSPTFWVKRNHSKNISQKMCSVCYFIREKSRYRKVSWLVKGRNENCSWTSTRNDCDRGCSKKLLCMQ